MQSAAFWAGLAVLGALWWGAVLVGLGRLLPNPVLYQAGATVIFLWAGQEWYWRFRGVRDGNRRS